MQLKFLQRNSEYCKDPFFALGERKFAVDLRKEKRTEWAVAKRKNEEFEGKQGIYEVFERFDWVLQGKKDDIEVLKALQMVREMFCSCNWITFDTLMKYRVLENLICVMTRRNCKFQNETTWIMCNLASGESETVDFLVNSGVLKEIIRLIRVGSEQAAENAIWCIGNIAGDSEKHSSHIISSDFLQVLCNFLNLSQKTPETLKISAWTLGNLSQKSSDFHKTEAKLLLFLTNFLISNNLHNATYDCLRIISGIVNKSEKLIQLVLDSDLAGFVLRNILQSSEEIQASSIRIVGCILGGSILQAQVLINLGVIEELQGKICSSSPLIRKEVLWAIGNVAAGSISQIAYLVDHPIMIIVFTGLLDHSSKARIEASWVFRNIGLKACRDSILLLVELGVLQYLIHGLEDCNSLIVENCLVLTLKILNSVKKKKSKIQELVYNSGILNAFESACFKCKNQEFAGKLFDN